MPINLNDLKGYPVNTLKNIVTTLDKPIKEYVRYMNREAPGNFGVEIELEAANAFPLHDPKITSVWNPIPDGSLRGNGIEFVTRVPLNSGPLRDAVDMLRTRLKEAGTQVNFSYRTSTHVHYNVRRHTMREILNHFAVYLLAEPILLRLAGPTRDGNLFCLPFYDTKFAGILIRRTLNHLVNDHHEVFPAIIKTGKYSALNTDPISSQGSLEYRVFMSTLDPDKVAAWTDVISAIDAQAKKIKSFKELASFVLSVYDDPILFANSIFGGCEDYKDIRDVHDLVQLGCEQALELAGPLRDFEKNLTKEIANHEAVLASLPSKLKVSRKSAKRVDI